jgi:hypothetical protein
MVDQRHAGGGDEPASELLWGEEAIEERLGGLRFRVRPNAFCRRTRVWRSGSEPAREAVGLTG